VAQDAIASPELAEKFKIEKGSPYLRFVRGEGPATELPNLPPKAA